MIVVFSLSALWWRRIRGLRKLPDGRDRLTDGKLGLVLMGGAMLSKSLIQFSVDGWSCVPSLLLTWGQAITGASLVAQLVKNLPVMVGDLGSIPGLGTWPGEGKGYPLQYSGLENSMKGGASLVAQTLKCLQWGRPGFDPWVMKISWRRKWQPTPVSLPGESHGRRSLMGYSPLGRKESDTTKQLHFHFSLFKLWWT